MASTVTHPASPSSLLWAHQLKKEHLFLKDRVEKIETANMRIDSKLDGMSNKAERAQGESSLISELVKRMTKLEHNQQKLLERIHQLEAAGTRAQEAVSDLKNDVVQLHKNGEPLKANIQMIINRIPRIEELMSRIAPPALESKSYTNPNVIERRFQSLEERLVERIVQTETRFGDLVENTRYENGMFGEECDMRKRELDSQNIEFADQISNVHDRYGTISTMLAQNSQQNHVLMRLYGRLVAMIPSLDDPEINKLATKYPDGDLLDLVADHVRYVKGPKLTNIPEEDNTQQPLSLLPYQKAYRHRFRRELQTSPTELVAENRRIKQARRESSPCIPSHIQNAQRVLKFNTFSPESITMVSQSNEEGDENVLNGSQMRAKPRVLSRFTERLTSVETRRSIMSDIPVEHKVVDPSPQVREKHAKMKGEARPMKRPLKRKRAIDQPISSEDFFAAVEDSQS